MGFSKLKDRILLGLEMGAKLHELMCEPGMPAKAMLEEWRDNDPEFEAAFQAASEKGRIKRGDPAPKPKPAPVVVDEDGGEHVIPRSTALRNEQPAASKPKSFKESDAIQRARILALHQAGGRTTDLLKSEKGFSNNKLAEWRRDPDFKAAWDAATQQVAQSTPSAPAAEVVSPTPTAPPYPPILPELTQHVAPLAASQPEATSDKERADKLQKFKEYVHNVLTAEGIDEYQEENELTGCRIGARLADVFQQLASYKEWGQDVKRLTRELDVALFGEENAAAQASLCDLISPARDLAASLRSYIAQAEQRDEQPAVHVALVAATGPEHPGFILCSLMRKAGTRRTQLAEALGVKPATLKELLAGNTSLSVELCGRLEKLCWGTAEVWARRQVDYNNHRQSLSIAA